MAVELDYAKAGSGLVESFANGVRSGPDVVVAEDVYFSTSGEQTVPVFVPDTLAECFPDLKEDEVVTVHEHVMSRHAQTGLNVHWGTGQQIADAYQNGGESKPVLVELENLTDRERYIHAGDPVFQLYQTKGSLLTGEELLAAHKQGEFAVDGSEEKHWKWHYANDRENVSNIDGMEIVLAKQARWIPPKGDIIVVDTDIRRYRKKIDRLLQPAPYTTYSIHWVGSTLMPIHLYGVHALIVPEIDRNSYHINSPFLQAGRTDWRVRTEINGPTHPALRARSIVVQFAKAA